MWLVELSNSLLSALSSGWRIIIDWLYSSLADVLSIASPIPIVGQGMAWLAEQIVIPVNGVNYTLSDITIIQLLFGVALPIFLAFTFVKWLLNLIT